MGGREMEAGTDEGVWKLPPPPEFPRLWGKGRNRAYAGWG